MNITSTEKLTNREYYEKYTRYDGRSSLNKKEKIETTCLGCSAAFTANGKFNRMCVICKEQYRNVLWVN